MSETRHYYAFDVGLNLRPWLAILWWTVWKKGTEVTWCYGWEDWTRG